MYVLIRHLTKSLRILTESAQKIAEGNYREQVEIHAKDETGMLADSYNKMAKAIEETIGELENKAKQRQSRQVSGCTVYCRQIRQRWQEKESFC